MLLVVTFPRAHCCLRKAFCSPGLVFPPLGAPTLRSFAGCASDSESLSRDDEPDDDVCELSEISSVGLLVLCSGSEPEVESLDDVPEDDVSSLPESCGSEDADELELEQSKAT